MQFPIFASCLFLCIYVVLSQSQVDQKVSAHLVIGSSRVSLDRIYDKSTQQYVNKATLSVQFGDQSLLIDLELAPHIVREDFKVLNIDEQGVETEVEHALDQRCTYEGTVEKNPLTRALLIMCDGKIRGVIQTGHTSHNLVHVDGVTYAETSPSQIETLPVEVAPIPSHFSASSVITNRRSISQGSGEIGVVLYIQPSLVTKIQGWKWSVDDFARLTVTRTNFLFNKVGVQVRLLAVKTIPEKFAHPSADIVMDQFTKWFQQGQPRTEDFSFLMTGNTILSKENKPIGGLGFIGQMCTALGTGICTISLNNPLNWGHLLSHEMGHSIGAADDYERRPACCPNTLCVMDVDGNVEEKWSDCSLREIRDFFSKPKTCLGSNKCAFGQWGPWSNRCSGGFQIRTQPVTSGPCQPFTEYRPAPPCTAPTAPRAGIYVATPVYLQMWACDPNSDWWVPLTVKTADGKIIGSALYADNFKGWDKWRDECLPGVQHTYEIKLSPPAAVGSQLTIFIGGLDNNKQADSLGSMISVTVGYGTPAAAIGEEEENAPALLVGDGLEVPNNDNNNDSTGALTPSAILAIVFAVVIVVALVGLAAYSIKRGIDRHNAENGHNLLAPEML